ncbi:MAG: SusC/RagA family protein [Marinilabiliales bacterium]|nr:MAG: SusC/RagA family protein [Marinilabiliales bacterium]
MKKIYLILIPLLFLMQLTMIAQEKTITGIVTSADDQLSIPGATVLIKGTATGTVTDMEGNYQLTNVSPEAVLVFSFIGMQTIEITVGDQTVINVVMEADVSLLDEVVVIGYGTVKKQDVTGAVSTVDAKTIDNLKPVRVEQALQGTMTGVSVTEQSGSPGAGVNIRIRGISTNGDPTPVVIIDGYQGDMTSLNPNDIESITVLKDAQAAIYGTVGANGVILITTKSGKRNTPTTFSFNSNFGFQQTSRKLPVLNANEYAILLNESYAANGQDLPYPDVSGLGEGTNWQDQLFSTAPIFDNNFSVSGGSEKMNYSASISDVRQQGTIGGDKSGYDRTNARVGLGVDLTKWLKLNTNIMYTHIDRTSFNDFGLGSVLFNGINMPSTVPVYDENGDYFLAPANLGIEIINPMAQIANTYNNYYLNKWNGNIDLQAKFAKHFTLTGRFGFNTINQDYRSFSMIVDYGGKVFDVTRSSVYQEKENNNDYTADLFMTYDNTFKEAHNLAVTLGTTLYQTWGNNLNATGWDIPNNSWEYADISLANGIVETKTAGSWVYDQRRASIFTRVQYDYKGKYLASAMFRRDASTKFAPEYAAAYFPSATLGWVMSKENFMSDIDKISLVKIRMSYGFLGSDKIPAYGYISQLNGEGVYVLNGQIVTGSAIGKLPNTSIKWEQSEQFDVGFDLSFFDEKLDFTADYFIKTTEDLLIDNVPVSGILGTHAPGSSGPIINAGTVRNSGFEFAVGWRGGVKENFVYRVNYNFTYLNNEVLEVNNGTGYVEGGSFGVGQPLPARMEVGYPIGYFYGYQTDGIFQTQEEVDAHPDQSDLGAVAQPGDIRFVDVNGDGVINSDDRTNIGDPIPDFIMGLNIQLNFHNFDFIAYLFSSIGNDVVRNYERAQPNVNRMDYWLDRWTGPGTSNTVPRVTTAATANNVFSEFYVEDGSYLRLQRVSLGYTFPEKWFKSKVKEFRLYVAVNNLFTITNYQGFDPAAYRGYDPNTQTGSPIGAGFDDGFYPAAKTFWFGLTLNL